MFLKYPQISSNPEALITMLQVSKSLPNFFLCNRPLHNAPLPAVSSAPLASDPKRWLQPNPNVLSISCQKTCRCCVWSKPVYFKIDGLWFWWEKTHPKVKAVFWDTGPCVDNLTGLQLVLSCPLWSDGKGKGQFTSQGGWNGFQLAKAISNPNRHFQPLSCSGPGFVKTKAQMVKTSDSWECQITPRSTQNR